MENKKRLIIIDSNSVVHRAFHSLPPFKTKKGELVNAVYGFLLIFFKAIRELKPEFVVATFDLAAPTFRHKQFKEYKAKRVKTPKELYQQIPIIKEVLSVFKVPVFEKEGFEADDIIGTISKQSSLGKTSLFVENIILSSDSDIFQLIDRNTKVYTSKRGLKDTLLYDEEAVIERYDLNPSQLIDFKALKGDSSDNIPGVPGVGEKTATKLLQEFGTLESLYDFLEKEELNELNKQKIQRIENKGISSFIFPFPPSLKVKLLKNKKQAFFSKMLVEIRRDVPINFNLEKCCWGEYNKEKIVQIFQELGFSSLIKRLD